MAVSLLAALAAVAGCYAAGAVVLPTVVALFLAMLLGPLASWLTRLGLGRTPAAFLAVTLAMAAIFLGGFGGYRAVAGVAAQAPRYESQLRQAARRAEAGLTRLRRRTQRLVPGGGAGRPEGAPPAGGQAAPVEKSDTQWESVLLRGLGSLVEAAGLALFVPFLALFFLMEQEPLSRAFDRAAGAGFDGARLRREAPRMARAYVYGSLLLALALAVVQGGLFLALGLPNAVALGLVTGLLNVIPILGLPLAVALPLLQGVGTLHGAAPFAAMAGALFAVHVVAANWIIPRWIGIHVKVNTTAATFAMLFFSWLWGLVGFLLAVPLAAIVKIALECSPRSRALAGFLASPEAPADAGVFEHPARGPWQRLRRHFGLRWADRRRRSSRAPSEPSSGRRP